MTADPRSAARDLAIDRSHFARLWPQRHDDRIVVFANGHVFDAAARRASLRQNLAAQRSAKRRLGVTVDA